MFDAQLFRKGEIIWKSRRVGVLVQESRRVGFKWLLKATSRVYQSMTNSCLSWKAESSRVKPPLQFKAQFALCFSPPPSVTNIGQHVVLRSLLASFALDEQCKLQQCCSSLIYFDYSREDIYLRENMCALGTAAQFLDNIDFCLAIWSIWAGGECAHSENRWVGVTWRPRKWLCYISLAYCNNLSFWSAK